MSLADELLADLDAPEAVESLEGDVQVKEECMDVDVPDIEAVEFKVPFIPQAASMTTMRQLKSVPKQEKVQLSASQVAKVFGSERLRGVMSDIEVFVGKQRKTEDISGPVEADPEYLLIVDANALAVEIDNDLAAIHKYVRDVYSKRFPELESLITTPQEYLTTVKKLGNDIDGIKNNTELQQYLSQATIMVVSVTASTTQGKNLTQEELDQVYEAYDMTTELTKCKEKILEYVESRMTFIAPNLSLIVGAPTAAKLLGIAGGLTGLSKMPSCNVLLLGQQKKVLGGFSQTQILPHTGLIYYCPTVQGTPPDLRRKVARLIAAKCTLAARVDTCHENADGSYGREMLTEIVKKMDRLQEPPPVKSVKALPAPIEVPRKRRGGKRVRKQKERLAQSELRKQYNRMAFGEIEEDAYQDDLGYNRGMVGKGGPGRLRGPTIDEKTKVRISKSLQKNLQKTQVYGGTTTVKRQVSGTASSVAFTPLQGLEIVNPQAAERVREANNKYFSSTTGFSKVQPGTSSSTQ